MKVMNNRKDDPMRTDRDFCKPGEAVMYPERIARLAAAAAAEKKQADDLTSSQA